ncbi:tripartite tricarboxylate transporter substrate binding protein [Achromobacter insolitus]|uniref:Bug family tripartite tricarboxylate transporter substrate binding protein n=1 Tax=Achromobacter TaxID=222 RepID=UPI0007C38ED0|nr:MULTISPECIES: tripartite tricarboxylate transporter substrate binding protein [Achromobacter]AXA70268.1 tripartite tricarboxylate transporter substrate binding protein [Achromobacter insolitus]MDQ6212803.1 tripartite tricarboxylate transporter substrate binding protein [Achromobacter insolitus]MEB3097261.1 tripartite tricarboxylate transporter substrate binding protein [Achromobacter sp. D10]OAD16714.1 ABC transporter substrate-binding protein [Achromobacter insolitus]WKK20288.1 tripartite 
MKYRAVVAAMMAGVLGMVAGGAVLASGYPSKPVRVIVPYVAGGAADITARVIAQKLSVSMGATFVVENKPGANGMIGTDFVAKAAPDGYTLLLDASGPLVVNPSLYKKTPYDPVADLAPISQITSYQYVLVVPQQSPIRSVDDLIAAARAKPGQVSYGSAGVGAGGHLAGELLAVTTQTQLAHIPYKGNAQALTDVLGGQLSFTFDTVVTATPHLRSGKLRGYAVTGPRRAPGLPDIPTMEELGYKDFVVTQFQGLLAPAGTDPAILSRLHEEVVKAARQPDVIQKLQTEGGNEIVAGTPQEFARLIQEDLQRYRKLIADAHVQAE